MHEIARLNEGTRASVAEWLEHDWQLTNDLLDTLATDALDGDALSCTNSLLRTSNV
jgi:hypothetical protein